MNDASNVIITNNQSDLTRIKFAKMNNKISTVVNISEIIQKSNQLKPINNNKISKNSEKSNNYQKNEPLSNKKSLIDNEKNINQNNKEQKNLNVSISFIEKNYFFLKLNRYCPIKIKILILILFLICSILFFSINIYDYIIYWKNEKHHNNKDNNKEWLSNNYIIFILQIIGSLFLLFFLCIIFFINQGESHNFIITCIISIIIFSSLRIFVFFKTIKIFITIFFNLIYSIFILLTNIVLLTIIMIINKKKKNVLQNIDEIVYFTENNMQTQKKEKDINSLDNSPDKNILKKMAKSVKLVEDDNDIKNKNVS